MSTQAYRRQLKKRSFYHKQRGLCFYCHIHQPLEDMTWDHLIRKSEGGTLANKNVVLSCWLCNQLREPGATLQHLVGVFRKQMGLN